jgi:hypothetical protein
LLSIKAVKKAKVKKAAPFLKRQNGRKSEITFKTLKKTNSCRKKRWMFLFFKIIRLRIIWQEFKSFF